MPLYPLRCVTGHEIEAEAKAPDQCPTDCPECGAPLTRVWTAPAIRFLGSGFHNTDYGKSRK